MNIGRCLRWQPQAMADGRSKTDEGFASCGGHWLLGSALLAVAVSSCERRCMCYKWQVATKRLTFPLVSTMVQTCNIQHLPAAGAGNACPSLPLSQRHAVDPNHPIICHLACTVTIDVAACKSGGNNMRRAVRGLAFVNRWASCGGLGHEAVAGWPNLHWMCKQICLFDRQGAGASHEEG